MRWFRWAVVGLQLGCSDSPASPTDGGVAEVFDGFGSDVDGLGNKCSAGELRYTDFACGPPRGDPGTSHCSEQGDGKCYQTCKVAADCKDPARPHCSGLGLFDGKGTCWKSVLICRASPLNECGKP